MCCKHSVASFFIDSSFAVDVTDFLLLLWTTNSHPLYIVFSPCLDTRRGGAGRTGSQQLPDRQHQQDAVDTSRPGEMGGPVQASAEAQDKGRAKGVVSLGFSQGVVVCAKDGPKAQFFRTGVVACQGSRDSAGGVFVAPKSCGRCERRA